MCVCAKIFVFLVIVDAAKYSTNASKKGRSSSSGEKTPKSSEGTVEDSLDLSIDSKSSSKSKESDDTSRDSTVELRGWRKYHRVCPPCPRDMAKKPTDKTISWVCGGYQKARRTFKSVCMMRLRNCQDGTMFVKLYDGICKAPRDGSPLGDHFFYDMREKDSDISELSDMTESSESNED
ncbi:uncharacterized protein LOC121735871 [Aricia agestis]|uniref:uncharacterized protein LOC121735871 n=1 Tax=Aricia agestis TaxID=91739 RepID=UPI001C20C0AC|nr:uncharacterized protein LOC121735871 [Aricia agestis]